jgi:protein-L-isoaspartate(D-aspartate) O-methyltransferase
MNPQAMVKLIRARGVKDSLVLDAMLRVPRHAFVPELQRASAYDDHAMAIGCEQTISQPYIVALMTEALELKTGDRVLEVGTGSGYQTAILAEMGAEVYTVERIVALHEAARACFGALGYRVQCKVDDGYYGWPEFAPYDAIIVTAAPAELPSPLVVQLAEGGRMVIPVGPRYGYQTLWKIVKEGGHIHKIDLGGVAFVPFVHVPDER